MGSERGELVGRAAEREPGELRDARRSAVRELRVGVEAGTDRSAADREVVEALRRDVEALEVGIELGDVAGELLTERERHRILQVRAPDLDDVG